MRLLRSSASFPPALHGAVAAIGNFDGVHLGHRALIAAAKAEAERTQKPLAVMTFEPHPRRFFVPSSPPFRLDALETKARILNDLGVKATLALPFTAELAGQSPQDFVDHILARDLRLSHVVVGYDFTFGKARAGNTEMLRDLGVAHHIGVTVVSAQGDGETYSSTRVRRLLEAGDVAGANRILGRPWEIIGTVEHGDKRGRELGYPTANVAMTDFQVPKFGIYAVRAVVAGETHNGVASLGIRPTFDQTDVKLEVYLFDFSGDLYGQSMRVEFHGFLRPEVKYEGPEPLKRQIAADVGSGEGNVALTMLDHVSITVPDIAAVAGFYDAVMQALDYPLVYARADARGYGLRADGMVPERSYISIYESAEMRPDPRRHWCFKAVDRAAVEAFHVAALRHGGSDDGAPGLRHHYHPSYFAAFVRDPAGNRIEAVVHR